MGKMMKNKTLMLEDYIGFFDTRDAGSLHMLQLNEILSLHNLCRQKVKGGVMAEMNHLEMINPRRSTLGDAAGVYPCAPLTLAEIKDDIGSLGWEECPIGSILPLGSAVSPKSKAPPRLSLPISTTTSSSAVTVAAGPIQARKQKRSQSIVHHLISATTAGTSVGAEPAAASLLKAKRRRRSSLSRPKRASVTALVPFRPADVARP